MGKFSFNKDYAKRASMHRDLEQHKKRGDNISTRKNKIFDKQKEQTVNPESEKNIVPETIAPVTVAAMSDEAIIQEINRLTDALRATNGQKEEQALRDFAAQHHLNLRVEAAVSKTDKSAISRMVFNGGVEKPFGGYSTKFANIANYPYKYTAKPGKPEDYNLESSSLWQAMAEEPRFAEMKDKMQKALATAGVPAEILPEMNLNDFKYLMFNHCAVQKGLGFAKLFQAKDENGNPLTRAVQNQGYRPPVFIDDTQERIGQSNIKTVKLSKEVPVCTSAKQENVMRFIKENPQFKDMMLKMPGAKKDYVETLVKKMATTGLTDMTKELERHPEWADQAAIDVHHIINIKDCRLFEAEGKSYTAVNNYENMCIVANGTLLDALNRSRGIDNKTENSIHGSIHSADMVFKDREKDGSVKRTMVRLEPAPGVRCMLGFSEDMMIMDQQNENQNNNHKTNEQSENDAQKQQLVIHNLKQKSGAMSA